ncbi:hypothetical protein HanRHA438_Chr15g0690731 [Helianthus annuus]|nr:hypothetical protein HanRHA438_Chr15g0690731 [Helianthus annuus]
MYKDLSQVPSMSQAVFLGSSQAVTVHAWTPLLSSEPLQLGPSRFRKLLVPFQLRRAVLAGSKPVQLVRAVSTYGSSRFSWLRPFELNSSRYSCLMTVQCVVPAGSTCCSSRLTKCRIYLPS